MAAEDGAKLALAGLQTSVFAAAAAANGQASMVNAVATGRAIGSAERFVDTHCHLEEVLQVMRRHAVAPSLGKTFFELNEVEAAHWRTLGWLQDGGGGAAGSGSESKPAPQVPKNATW